MKKRFTKEQIIKVLEEGLCCKSPRRSLLKSPKIKKLLCLLTQLTKPMEFRMQKRIWSQYNKDLVQRGSITFFIEEKTLQKIQNFRGKSTGGRPQEFPLVLIQLLLFIKIQYSLTYQGLEGFAKSILQKMYSWFEVPSYSLICKRAKELSRSLPELSSRRPSVVLIDASGIQVFGESEWKRKIHGVGRR